jgi:hypothetical protein
MIQTEIKTAIHYIRTVMLVQVFTQCMLVLWLLFGVWGVITDYFSYTISHLTDPAMRSYMPWVVTVVYITYALLLSKLSCIRPNRELVKIYTDLINELSKQADYLMFLRDELHRSNFYTMKEYQELDSIGNAINRVIASSSMVGTRGSLRPRDGWSRSEIARVAMFAEVYLILLNPNERFEIAKIPPA